MTRLKWHAVESRFFEAGLDRGVLYFKNGQTSAWDGLTSVEESGSEGSQAYYHEGRPFLHVPKPKEFEATVKAYTYPEALAAVMGMDNPFEARGMYLDSQQGDSFGMSYRTRIGNATEGVDHAYKIHVIYNATITSPGGAYNSLSGEVNPSEFTWNISAVPDEILDYRPTAHVVIDSRKISPHRLKLVEDLLYGTATSVPRLPPLQELYDILSFLDSIVISDLGNGRWSAEGSSKNVITEGDRFTIKNVDATIHANGTFTIRTTNT